MENIDEVLAGQDWLPTDSPVQQSEVNLAETVANEGEPMTIEDEINAEEAGLEEGAEEDTSIEIRRIIDISNKSYSVRRIFEMYKEGKIRFDLAIQRGLVWNNIMKSSLIDSLIVGLPIPLFFTWNKESANSQYVLDGKQRLTTIIAFLENQLAFDKTAKPVLGKEVAKLYFDELSEDFKNNILDTILEFKVIEEQDTEVISEIMRRLNQSVKMGNFDIMKSGLGEELMSYIKNMSMHPFLAEKCTWTNKQLQNSQDQETVVRILMMNCGEADWSLAGITDFCSSLKRTGVQEWLHEKTKRQLDCLYATNITKTKGSEFFKITHLPTLTQIVPDTEYDNEKFSIQIQEWWKNRGEEYKAVSNSGTGQPTNVNKRLSLIREYFEALGYTYEI